MYKRKAAAKARRALEFNKPLKDKIRVKRYNAYTSALAEWFKTWLHKAGLRK